MPINGVIFDLFHTLTGLDAHRSGPPRTDEVLGVDRQAWLDALSASRWRLVGEDRDPTSIVRRLVREVGASVPEDRIAAAVEGRVRRFEAILARIPASNVTTLRALRSDGLRIGLVSNADVMEIATWHDCALSGLFDVELFSCHVGQLKPEAGIYRECLEQLDLPAEQCLFVGDGGSEELTGARNVGLTTVLMAGVVKRLWPHVVPERRASADHRIDAIPELRELLASQ